MNGLNELQGRFQAAVLDGSVAMGQEPWLSGHFHIYADAYRGRLTEALADNFPVLFKALGDEAFAGLAAAYVRDEPSTFRSIRWFGHRLIQYVEERPGLLPHPALTDLARMDWALRGAFDAADAAMLEEADVARIPTGHWPNWRFVLHPSVRLVALDWQVEPVWHALNENGDCETTAPEPLPHTLLVWRRNLDCQWRSLDDIETAALRALMEGRIFGEVCAALEAAGSDDPAGVAAGLLRRWLDDGMLAR